MAGFQEVPSSEPNALSLRHTTPGLAHQVSTNQYSNHDVMCKDCAVVRTCVPCRQPSVMNYFWRSGRTPRHLGEISECTIFIRGSTGEISRPVRAVISGRPHLAVTPAWPRDARIITSGTCGLFANLLSRFPLTLRPLPGLTALLTCPGNESGNLVVGCTTLYNRSAATLSIRQQRGLSCWNFGTRTTQPQNIVQTTSLKDIDIRKKTT
ncbi:hypothetical protein Bbelb_103700 [Branchiostoma belcheri]|nr:hypothetical protein Bbelb_103700 [Branchiostoma belcheri]